MRDRFGRKKRAFKRLRRSNVGALGALAHRNANAGAGEIDAAAGNRLALLDEGIDRLRRQDGDVAARPALEVLQESVRGPPGGRNFRIARAFECGD